MTMNSNAAQQLSGELLLLCKTLRWGQQKSQWLRAVRASDVEDSRTIQFDIHPPSKCDNQALAIAEQYELMLLPPLTLSVYFPGSLDSPPFCFCDEDYECSEFAAAAGAAAGVASSKLSPLAHNSLLHMVAVLQRVAAERRSQLWPPGPAPLWARTRTEALIAARVAEDRLACELSVALMAIAFSSYRRDTVADPLPFSGSNRIEHLRAVLLRLPPLKVIAQDPSILSSLDSASLAFLCGALIASPVRFCTICAPGASLNADDAPDSCCATGAWTEIGVTGRCPDLGFEALKAEHGVVTGYHGSAAENFHSICHKGLENRSGSKGEKNGAIFGAGVYLATACEVARSFAARAGERPRVHNRSAFAPSSSDCGDRSTGREEGWSEFPFDLVARCDVINVPNNVAPRVAGRSDNSTGEHDYLVVQDEQHIQLSSLLLFPTEGAHKLRPQASPNGVPATASEIRSLHILTVTWFKALMLMALFTFLLQIWW